MSQTDEQWMKWMEHPQMKHMDPLKQELIRMAFERTRGKSGKSLAPIMMSIITGANKKGIRFSQEEIELLLQMLKEGKSSEEKAQIDQMVAFVNAAWKKRSN